MLVKKAYKYRIYPEIDQTHFINQTCGACRKVYNVFIVDTLAQVAGHVILAERIRL